MVSNLANTSGKVGNEKPLISFVLAGRNDNYGGDFKSRLQRCVSTLYNQLQKFGVPSEIIFVNYNPLSENKVEQFISWPKSNDLTTVKIITVAPDVHLNFIKNHNVKNIPVLEYPAKNVGIRRAKGEFVLAMNPDIIIDEAFYKDVFRLNKACYYRCNRFDFHMDEKQDLQEDIITYAKKHVCKVWVKAISKEIKTGSYSQSKFCLILLSQKLEIIRYGILRAFNFLWSKKLHPKAENKFHCNVSGDFMLMHSDNWNALMCYKEDSNLALHIDALMVVQAATLGLKEIVLKYPIYHQEHARRFDATIENAEFRDAYLMFQEEAQKMIKNKKPIQYNSIEWGFANSKLEEIQF
ncbi:MAG: hypothetical protein RIQ59_1292 [Bacteroidota bacterium]|jgi:hypothetical protein